MMFAGIDKSEWRVHGPLWNWRSFVTQSLFNIGFPLSSTAFGTFSISRHVASCRSGALMAFSSSGAYSYVVVLALRRRPPSRVSLQTLESSQSFSCGLRFSAHDQDRGAGRHPEMLPTELMMIPALANCPIAAMQLTMIFGKGVETPAQVSERLCGIEKLRGHSHAQRAPAAERIPFRHWTSRKLLVRELGCDAAKLGVLEDWGQESRAGRGFWIASTLEERFLQPVWSLPRAFRYPPGRSGRPIMLFILVAGPCYTPCSEMAADGCCVPASHVCTTVGAVARSCWME